jgi:hypothetical protein
MYNVERARQDFFNSYGSGTVALSTTVYGALCSSSSLTGTENARQNIIPIGGTFKNFYVQTGTTQSALNSLVLTVRKNTASTSIVVTIAAGAVAGSYSDLTNTDTGVAGDVYGVQIANNAAATSAAIIGTGIYFFK